MLIIDLKNLKIATFLASLLACVGMTDTFAADTGLPGNIVDSDDDDDGYSTADENEDYDNTSTDTKKSQKKVRKHKKINTNDHPDFWLRKNVYPGSWERTDEANAEYLVKYVKVEGPGGMRHDYAVYSKDGTTQQKYNPPWGYNLTYPTEIYYDEDHNLPFITMNTQTYISEDSWKNRRLFIATNDIYYESADSAKNPKTHYRKNSHHDGEWDLIVDEFGLHKDLDTGFWSTTDIKDRTTHLAKLVKLHDLNINVQPGEKDVVYAIFSLDGKEQEKISIETSSYPLFYDEYYYAPYIYLEKERDASMFVGNNGKLYKNATDAKNCATGGEEIKDNDASEIHDPGNVSETKSEIQKPTDENNGVAEITTEPSKNTDQEPKKAEILDSNTDKMDTTKKIVTTNIAIEAVETKSNPTIELTDKKTATTTTTSPTTENVPDKKNNGITKLNKVEIWTEVLSSVFLGLSQISDQSAKKAVALRILSELSAFIANSTVVCPDYCKKRILTFDCGSLTLIAASRLVIIFMLIKKLLKFNEANNNVNDDDEQDAEEDFESKTLTTTTKKLAKYALYIERLVSLVRTGTTFADKKNMDILVKACTLAIAVCQSLKLFTEFN